MKKLISVLTAAAIMLCTMLAVTVSASAAVKWNGTSTLKNGTSYSVTGKVTMDSKFTVPAKTTLTVAKGGTLTIAKGVTATINGKLVVNSGGTLIVNGTLKTDEASTLKVAGKLSYSGSAKLSINGTYTVTSTGTVSGSGSAEINLSSKSQYNSDIDKINTYLEKKNYSKACQLLENAISAYPDKKASLQSAYSSAVIDWADSLADNKEYLKACSILTSAKNYLSDTTAVTKRYDFYQGYIPVRLASLTSWERNTRFYDWESSTETDDHGNTFYDACTFYTNGSHRTIKYKIDGKYTNFKATLAHRGKADQGSALLIYVDDVLTYRYDEVTRTTNPFGIDVDITGATYIEFVHTGGYTNSEFIIVDSAVFYKQ